VTYLKGGHVVALRAVVDGEVRELRNEDGKPITFIVEDNTGTMHELYMTVGRMGTYPMFSAPAFQATSEGDFGERRGEQQGPRTKVAVPPSKAKTTV
jgi:hypothetical protein